MNAVTRLQEAYSFSTFVQLLMKSGIFPEKLLSLILLKCSIETKFRSHSGKHHFVKHIHDKYSKE